jgi:hypothetical protein
LPGLPLAARQFTDSQTLQAVRGITVGLPVILDQFGNTQAVSDNIYIERNLADL